MLLAVISDIHDNLWNLRTTLRSIGQSADMLFCCGDLCSPFVVDELAKFPRDLHIVFGNNDADLFRITSKASKKPKVYLHGELFEGVVQEKRIAMHHFDYVARPLAKSGNYDVVFFGHNHELEISKVGSCLLVNPGAIMGAKFSAGAWEDTAATYVLFETQTGLAEAFYMDGTPHTDGCRD